MRPVTLGTERYSLEKLSLLRRFIYCRGYGKWGRENVKALMHKVISVLVNAPADKSLVQQQLHSRIIATTLGGLKCCMMVAYAASIRSLKSVELLTPTAVAHADIYYEDYL